MKNDEQHADLHPGNILVRDGGIQQEKGDNRGSSPSSSPPSSPPPPTLFSRVSAALGLPPPPPHLVLLDVGMAADFLTVSRDTVYRLFQSGQLPGRKVGRKWVTTKAAVIRWLEHSSAHDSLARAVDRGDREALTNAIKDGKVRIK